MLICVRCPGYLFPWLVLLSMSLPLDAADRPVDFSREVLPVLSNKCFVCHGADGEARDALRLDSFEGATREQEGRRAIDPREPKNSQILVRIHSVDDPMPPADAAKQGQYEVRLVYACANGTAGNTFELKCADSRLTGKIVGTGTWDNYRTTSLGRVRLPAGRIRVLIAPVGDPNNCLMDLQELVFVPVK